MKKMTSMLSLVMFCFISLQLYGQVVENPLCEYDELAGKRARLYVHNYTNHDVNGAGGEGRYLKLHWSGQVYSPFDSTLPFDGEDYASSSYVGNGNNYRTITVDVTRDYFGNLKYIGSFSHKIYIPPLPPGTDAPREHTGIYKQLISGNRVSVFRKYEEIIDGKIIMQTEPIGVISLDEWNCNGCPQTMN